MTNARKTAWVTVALTMSGLAAGCGLRRDILEPPPVDGATPQPDGSPGDGANCAQRFVPGVGCTEMDVACIPAGVCPPTWQAAQERTTCTGRGSIILDSCGTLYRWINSNGQSVNWCYYDAATLVLRGAQLGAGGPVYCATPGDGGAFSVVVGLVPPAECEPGDAGTVFSSMPCQPFDGGASD